MSGGEPARHPCRDGKADAVCEGPKNRDGCYGWGMADALDAVTW